MKRDKEPEGRELNPGATSMLGYNSGIDAIRETEFPMLQGRFAHVHKLWFRDSRTLQEQPISTTQAPLYAPNPS